MQPLNFILMLKKGIIEGFLKRNTIQIFLSNLLEEHPLPHLLCNRIKVGSALVE